jgi:type IV pilus assembly protein PilN
MLQINLLPVRTLRRRAAARNQIIAIGIVLLGVLAVFAIIGTVQRMNISALEQQAAAKQAEKSAAQIKVRELTALQNKVKDIEFKIDLIEQLTENLLLAVHVLDDIATFVDNDRMWLTSLSNENNRLLLSGYAVDNQSVAEFMDRLKLESQFIESVDLTRSTLSNYQGAELTNFSLSCAVGIPAAEKEEKSDQ